MRIGILSSHGIKCAVAENAVELAGKLREQGHAVTIFGNWTDGRIRPEHRGRLTRSEPEAVACFEVQPWSRGAGYDLELVWRQIMGWEIRALLVEYQASIYPGAFLTELLARCAARGLRRVVTFHDSYIPSGLPELADVRVVHGASLLRRLPGATVIPQGVQRLPEVPRREVQHREGWPADLVATLGMGKVDYRLIYGAARSIGWTTLAFDPLYSCTLPNAADLILLRDWFDQRELVGRLAAAHATVLWYPPVDAQVVSSAAQLAVAAHRLVLVNNGVPWFQDLPADVFVKLRDPGELAVWLQHGLVDPERERRQQAFIDANCWDQVARRYLELVA